MNKEQAATPTKETASKSISTNKSIPTDDESITTSTESSVYETWTLVKDNNKKSSAEMLLNDDDKPDDKINSQSKQTEKAPLTKSIQNSNDQTPDIDSTNDDLSDGISIISESDSTGRLTPHPFLREQLNNLNMALGTDHDEFQQHVLSHSQLTLPCPSAVSRLEDIDMVPLRQRRKKSTTAVNRNESNLLQNPIENTQQAEKIRTISWRIFPIVSYAGIVLAVLGLVGILSLPGWQSLSSSNTAVVALEQKLNELELQNNLMRAEIDILTKQVNYLSALNGVRGGPATATPQHQHQYNKRAYDRKEKMFKAWSGNGNSMEAEPITKNDLKRPYKCSGGNFVEVAGMCIENKPHEQPLVEQIGQVVNDVLQQTNPYRTIENLAENFDTLVKNPFDNAEQEMKIDQTDAAPTKPDNIKVKATEEKNNYKLDQQYSKEYKRSSEKYEHNSRERGNGGKYEKQRHQQNRKYREKRDVVDNNSSNDESFIRRALDPKERFDKQPKNVRNSEERNNSKERSERKPHRKHPSMSDERSDERDWHEKLMKQRENARHQHERHYNDKNWYIKRGDSRENLRQASDVRYR